MNVSTATRVMLCAGVLVGASACKRDPAPETTHGAAHCPAECPEPAAAEAESGEARGAQGLSERAEDQPRQGQPEHERPRPGAPEPEPTNVQAALSATQSRLRDCDLGGVFYFFFEPGSAALRSAEFERARQLNVCLSRAAEVPEIVVVGRGELGTDLQSGVSLALSRAHNVAQAVSMDGAAREGVVLRTEPPQEASEGKAAWERRVEVRVQSRGGAS